MCVHVCTYACPFCGCVCVTVCMQSRKRKPVSTNGNKRRKVSASDDESNSLDGGVKWDTSSQTVTYENPMAK